MYPSYKAYNGTTKLKKKKKALRVKDQELMKLYNRDIFKYYPTIYPTYKQSVV